MEVSSSRRKLQTEEPAIMCGTLLIPGLPNELSMAILARLPRLLQARLRLVSHSWKDAMESLSLGTLRRSLGVSELWPFSSCEYMVMDDNKIVFSVTVSPDPHAFSCDASPTHLPPVKEIGIPSPPQLQEHRCCFEFQIFNSVGSKVLVAAFSRQESLNHAQGIYIFDVVSMRWGHCVPLNRRALRSVVASQGVVDEEGDYMYVPSACPPIERFNRLDLRKGRWEALPALHIERTCAAVVVLRGCLFVIGGVNTHVPGAAKHAHCSGEVWDPRSRVWTLMSELWPADIFKDELRPRVAVVRDQLYALKGHFPDEQLMHYEASTKKWISLGSLPADSADVGVRFWDDSFLLSIGEELWLSYGCTPYMGMKPSTVSQPPVWRVLSSTIQDIFRWDDYNTYVDILLVFRDLPRRMLNLGQSIHTRQVIVRTLKPSKEQPVCEKF